MFRLGLALGWLLLLAYALWLLHNAAPLLATSPRPPLAEFVARMIALPAALTIPGVPLAATLGVVMLLLLFVLLTLTIVPLPASLPSRMASEPRRTVDTSAATPSTAPLAEPQLPAPGEPLEPAASDAIEVAEVAETPAAGELIGGQVVALAEDAAPPSDGQRASAEARPAPPRVRQTVKSQRVFISSTSLDLHAHRKRVHDDLERMYQVPVDMAQFGAGAADAVTVSYTELATADIVVLIVAWRYGFIPAGKTRSVTELEYAEARRLKLPVYVYLADPATEADDGPDALFPAATRQPEHAAQLAAFRARLSDSNANVYDTFDSPADLSAKVVTALARDGLRRPQSGRFAPVEARALDRRAYRMGDDDAATFTYQIAPLQGAWEAATHALANASAGAGGKRGVVVLGEANAGKTRLALEALIATLPEWGVVTWSESATLADVQEVAALPDERLVLFIDDLQRYAPMAQRSADGRMAALASNPAAILRDLIGALAGRTLVIVATCRSEEEQPTHAELSWLFDKLATVRLPQFSEKPEDAAAWDVLAEFATQGATHLEDWDGTLGSLVLGLSTKRAQYEELAARRSPAADVLRAMKLLTEARVYAHTERRLRATCAGVFHDQAIAVDERAWVDAYEELLRLQFVRIADDDESDDAAGAIMLVIRKDTYFDADKVISDYPNPRDPGQVRRHLAALQTTFAALGDAAGLFSLGNSYYIHGDYVGAVAAYDRALALRPGHADTWVNTGVALGQAGRTEEALAAYDHALALRPDDADTWHNKGFMLGELGRNAEALAAYDQALALRPDDAATWHNKGFMLGELGRNAEALAAYDQALALQPNTASAWNGKGYAQMALQRYDDGVASIDHALALEPENPDWWDSRGEVLLAAGRAQEALAAYDEALTRAPDLASSRAGKAQALRALGRDAEADTLDGGGAP